MSALAVALVFGGPSDERDISAGSLKPWVTYLSDDPGIDLVVVFVGVDLRAYRLPARYWYTNTCADFADDLGPDELLDDAALDELLRAQDLVVPVMHGAYGEDGGLQRRLETLGVAYLFSTPEALSLSFDKARTYERLAQHGFAVPRHRVVESAADAADAFAWARRELRPRDSGGVSRLCAVKPVCSGSSLGVTLCADEPAAFEQALANASRTTSHASFAHDRRVLVEQLLGGREFSVLVMEDEHGRPCALAPTEVEARHELYDTRQKYLHGGGALLHTPIRDADLVAPIRDHACRAFAALGMRHLARVDGFVDGGTVYVSDVNGISGMGFSSFVFLQTSMVGLSHDDLIRRLVGRAAGRAIPAVVGDATGERADDAWRATPRGREGARGRRVHLLFGGATSERQVSRQSGIFAGLCLLSCGDDVHFHLMGTDHRFREVGLFLALHHDVEEIEVLASDPQRMAEIARQARRIRGELGLSADEAERHLHVGPVCDLPGAVQGADAVFLALHGGAGEDGTIQSALELLGVPHNGCGARASALCADKFELLEAVAAAQIEGVRIPRHRRIDRLGMLDRLTRLGSAAAWTSEFERLCAELDASAIICKPASDGCSTGVKLLRDGESMRRFLTAIVELRERVPAGSFYPGSREIALPVPMPSAWMFEQAVVEASPTDPRLAPGSRAWFDARQIVELTCAVVEIDGRMLCATPTIALSADSELSLEEKFQQGVGTNLLLGSFIEVDRVATVRRRIEAVAAVAGLTGYARIDCFLDTRDDSLVLIEVNTIPGMTEATVFYTQVLDAFGWPPARVLAHLLGTAMSAQRTIG